MDVLYGLSVWQWIGAGLTLWVVWDLITGHVYSYRSVYRAEEPGYYWVMVVVWAAVAAWCLFGMDALIGSGS
ncbi:MAG: hypothetical protein VXW22_03930 [Pseudomonadota bacterium]|nr:hypothetical protein [Pseudomonadota bacterium]